MPDRIRNLIPVRGVFEIEGAFGVSYLMEFDGRDGSLEWICWGGLSGYELPTQRVLGPLLEKAQCFVDVGANLGGYTMAAALQPHRPRVHAFEPEPYTLSRLRRNVQLNGLDNVTVHAEALADRHGTMRLHVPAYGYTTSSLLPSPGSHPVEVAVETLDEWATRDAIQRVDVIKMDTEGTEDRVLSGGRRLIDRDRPFIICEVLHGQPAETELTSLIHQAGYVAYHLTSEGPERQDTIQGDPTFLEVNFLLAHHDRVRELSTDYGWS